MLRSQAHGFIAKPPTHIGLDVFTLEGMSTPGKDSA